MPADRETSSTSNRAWLRFRCIRALQDLAFTACVEVALHLSCTFRYAGEPGSRSRSEQGPPPRAMQPRRCVRSRPGRGRRGRGCRRDARRSSGVPGPRFGARRRRPGWMIVRSSFSGGAAGRSVRAARFRAADRSLAEAGASPDQVARQLLRAAAEAGDRTGLIDQWMLSWLSETADSLVTQAPTGRPQCGTGTAQPPARCGAGGVGHGRTSFRGRSA